VKRFDPPTIRAWAGCNVFVIHAGNVTVLRVPGRPRSRRWTFVAVSAVCRLTSFGLALISGELPFHASVGRCVARKLGLARTVTRFSGAALSARLRRSTELDQWNAPISRAVSCVNAAMASALAWPPKAAPRFLRAVAQRVVSAWAPDFCSGGAACVSRRRGDLATRNAQDARRIPACARWCKVVVRQSHLRGQTAAACTGNPGSRPGTSYWIHSHQEAGQCRRTQSHPAAAQSRGLRSCRGAHKTRVRLRDHSAGRSARPSVCCP